jgi:hypothetical protein
MLTDRSVEAAGHSSSLWIAADRTDRSVGFCLDSDPIARVLCAVARPCLRGVS